MHFVELPVGSRFTIPHLRGVVMVKVEEKFSDGTNRKSFYGTYNAVALGGGRWVWDEHQLVLPR